MKNLKFTLNGADKWIMNAEESLLKRYQIISDEINAAAIAAGRDPDSVRLVAVSKTHSFESIKTLYKAGQRDFGENYVQELIEKSERAKNEGLDEIRWHFIGHLQTNKVKSLLSHASLIHGVGSLRLAEEIEKRAAGQKISVLIEVNLDQENTKSGAPISELPGLVHAILKLKHIELKGLMCIPDPNRPGGAPGAFQHLSTLAKSLGLKELSMGMTSDFKDAITQGATWVRIGAAIFGERSPREKL